MVTRDGKTAVFVSAEYGAGWSTWNNDDFYVFGDETLNEMLEEIRKEPKQLHFDEGLFFPCFYIDIKNVVSCNEAFQYVKASGGGKSGTISKAVDHPAFAALREHLGREGFIKIERGWLNGDCVTRPFYLNDVFFDVGKKFVCADAMKYTLKSRG